ncbi:bifunctional enoyl-CoA hydratase/phosphate acetyltransferase [Sporofaciens musculi]|uniref:bifunctional enoyl-CoA hydratase/phosphate acetyltransferase n=1 Tax=Sporofaciens musculi TaxID=2681861 RepID=UPI0025711817|nr:bifunctional enoyl-CoA hydratase/phosphate acetyltransferase [Sporofaciens musculi]
MYCNFSEMMNAIQTNTSKKVVAVAAAHDHEVLECAAEAKKEQLADFILIGKTEKIKEILTSLGENPDSWNMIEEPNDSNAAIKAVELASEKKADALMKGLLHTSVFLRALFNKEYGLVPPKALVSQVTVTEYPAQNRLVLITDCAVNVEPTYAEKVQILNNAVSLAHRLGNDCPNAACITAVEVVNEKMPETIDAAMLSKANERGQIKGCLVDGPLALDNALSVEAAVAKSINSPVAGHADILLMPNLCTGNALDKSLRYFAGLKTGSAVIGANVPIIMTSRSDSAQNKLHAIVLSVL